MLLLDGCFILELSLKYQEKAHDIKCRPGFLFDPIWMDLLLFENQIPFFVVEKLFSLVITKSHDSHELLVNIFTNLFLTKETLGPPLILRGKIHHLLHLYHEIFVSRLESRCKSYQSNRCFPSLKILEEGNYRKKLVIPCATRLREAGVKFSYKRSYEHKFDIKFKRGVIEIPTLKIDSNHKPLYPNLIAFEVCLCYEYRTLSSYIVLLDLLINTREDVELLQRSGVIENTLPNEEEMAAMLSEPDGTSTRWHRRPLCPSKIGARETWKVFVSGLCEPRLIGQYRIEEMKNSSEPVLNREFGSV
ncbi:UPF0481 protein At3g47200-like [Carex rostrata]